ncbi:MAG: ABC-F family ATP-binding cassette domain-containing protein [Thermodesulfobacteriota bacterium]|nr:ABC-F family ATP-binding cassette domain-containing protein [Thermodesulfobacteriota bacterium]
MISIENLSRSYGDQILFDSVSFRINHRERVGVVGRNGHGKTTLFRLITGETHPDSGLITTPKNYCIGCVRQQIKFIRDTVLAEGMTGLSEPEKDHHWKVEKILFGLGFTASDMQRRPGEFSGGFQVRLNLAKVLVAEPDLLLLDEPTNYLDITSIRWITRFLSGWPRELMLITHDRSFMDGIVTHTMGIHRKKIRKIAGNTEKYYSQIALDEEIYEKTRINDEKHRKEIELFINRFRAKARLANLVQSRIKTLAKTEKRGKLETIKSLGFSFRAKPFSGKHAMNAQNLTFSYNTKKPLIQNLDFTVSAGERICVVGKNGKGKTTLLKLLAGRLTPQSGEIVYNPNITRGVFEQTHIKSLMDTRTVEEEILYSHQDVDRQTARNICGAMMFSGDDALKKISILSGGEKSRVMLGKLMVTPVNLLLLDEPTNHLDMDACEALLAAIDNFNGTVIMVTHNEMFLHALAQKLIVFQADQLKVFHGGYQEFLEKGGWKDEDRSGKPDRIENSVEHRAGRPNRKDMRKKRSGIITEKGKTLKPMKDRMLQVEEEIERSETEIAQINKDLASASLPGNGSRIADLSRQLNTRQAAIDSLYDEFETLTTGLEKKQAEFEKQLTGL